MTAPPQRIVSLVPSLTELLCTLGLEDRIAGRTRFCIHPADKVGSIPVIGGTKNPGLDKIEAADPDFILANREENRKEDVEALAASYRLHLTDIASIEDALIEIHQLGSLLGTGDQAKQLTRQISERLDNRPDEPPVRVAYLIWRDPWMTVGGDTYINDVLAHWGLMNVFGDRQRYPKITLREMRSRYPELILLSSEPFPFKKTHENEIRDALPGTRVLLVEGEWFSWYGSRMLSAFEKLNVWRKAIA